MINIKELIIYFLFWLGTVITLIAIIAFVVCLFSVSVETLTGINILNNHIRPFLHHLITGI